MDIATLMALSQSKLLKGKPKKVRKPRLAKKSKRSIQAKSRMGVATHPKPKTGGVFSSQKLMEEAQSACDHYMAASRFLFQKNIWAATNSYFRAAAIASNVLFTANTHGVAISGKCREDMNKVICDSTLGIKKLMQLIALRRIRKHVRKHHPKGSSFGLSKSSTTDPQHDELVSMAQSSLVSAIKSLHSRRFTRSAWWAMSAQKTVDVLSKLNPSEKTQEKMDVIQNDIDQFKTILKLAAPKTVDLGRMAVKG